MRRLPVVTFIVSALALAHAGSQAPPTSSRPTFDVISLKPTSPSPQKQLRFDYCQPSGRFAMYGTPVFWSLKYAYQVKDFQIIGAPDWVNGFETAYDIEAKASGPASADQCRLMVQSLFEDRFKLKLHHEARVAPAYLLTIAKNGSKLRQGGAVRFNGGQQVMSDGKPQWPDGLTMSALATILSNYTDRPVIDQTALKGSYGIALDFSTRDGDDRPSIFTAVQEQLGLRLESGKAQVDTLVIDHIERPTPD